MKRILLSIMVISLFSFLAGCDGKAKDDSSKAESSKGTKETKFANYINVADTKGKTTMTLIGHASVKIVSKDGKVIYIDPYYNGDYTQKGDIVLVTHNHDDHNHVDLVTLNANGTVLKSADMLKDGTYQTKDINSIKIEAVSAENSNHKRSECVGYIITVDGITVYHAGDTSKIDDMTKLADRNLDYALLPTDGIYNMSSEEATECADIIKAKHSIPIHVTLGQADYDLDNAKLFTPKNGMLVEYGKTIELTK